jgi:hypothetical protein
MSIIPPSGDRQDANRSYTYMQAGNGGLSGRGAGKVKATSLGEPLKIDHHDHVDV